MSNIATMPTSTLSTHDKLRRAREIQVAARSAALDAYTYLTDLDKQTRKARNKIQRSIQTALESGDDALLTELIATAEKAGVKFDF